VIERYQKNQLLKAEEIAAMLGLKVQTIYTMARRGELEKVKLSRKCLRFRADDVERFIEQRQLTDRQREALKGSILAQNPGYYPGKRA
jgi:excisionase family DNA binding protein